MMIIMLYLIICLTFYDHIQTMSDILKPSHTISYILRLCKIFVRSVRVIAPVLYHIVEGFCTSQCGQTI